jgi:hypothetical protein
MSRASFFIGTLMVGALAIAVACGGREQPLSPPGPGYVDDAGLAHYSDGGVVPTRGGACVGFDSGAFASLYPLPSCSSDAECQAWLSEHVPKGYASQPACVKQGGSNPTYSCGADFLLEYSQTLAPMRDQGTPYCTPGPEGDAYCQALFDQFVVGDAHVAVGCHHRCNLISPEHGASYCEPNSDYSICEALVAGYCGCVAATDDLDLCVYRGDSDAATCEPPCAPPPAALADAGTD